MKTAIAITRYFGILMLFIGVVLNLKIVYIS